MSKSNGLFQDSLWAEYELNMKVCRANAPDEIDEEQLREAALPMKWIYNSIAIDIIHPSRNLNGLKANLVIIDDIS